MSRDMVFDFGSIYRVCWAESVYIVARYGFYGDKAPEGGIYSIRRGPLPLSATAFQQYGGGGLRHDFPCVTIAVLGWPWWLAR